MHSIRTETIHGNSSHLGDMDTWNYPECAASIIPPDLMPCHAMLLHEIHGAEFECSQLCVCVEGRQLGSRKVVFSVRPSVHPSSIAPVQDSGDEEGSVSLLVHDLFPTRVF